MSMDWKMSVRNIPPRVVENLAVNWLTYTTYTTSFRQFPWQYVIPQNNQHDVIGVVV